MKPYMQFHALKYTYVRLVVVFFSFKEFTNITAYDQCSSYTDCIACHTQGGLQKCDLLTEDCETDYDFTVKRCSTKLVDNFSNHIVCSGLNEVCHEKTIHYENDSTCECNSGFERDLNGQCMKGIKSYTVNSHSGTGILF